MTSLRLLQIVLAALTCIPLLTGLGPLWSGLPRGFANEPWFAHLDSEYRFRTAIWVSISVGVWFMIPSIQSQTLMLRFLMGALIFGGFARLWSLWRERYRFAPWLIGPLFAELILAPLMIVWQAQVRVG